MSLQEVPSPTLSSQMGRVPRLLDFCSGNLIEGQGIVDHGFYCTHNLNFEDLFPAEKIWSILSTFLKAALEISPPLVVPCTSSGWLLPRHKLW